MEFFAARVFYDSKWAANVGRQRWRARCNVMLAGKVASAVAQAAASFDLSWQWVKGHSDNEFNEKADAAANMGASGETADWQDRGLAA